MTIRSVIALTVVCGSACIALETQLSSERQSVAVVNADNPYVFTTPNQPHMFTVTTQSSTDVDTITAIRFDNPSACQNFRIEPVTLPATICSGSAQSGCPRNLSFAVTYLGTGTESCDIAIDWEPIGSGSGSGGPPIAIIPSYLRLSSNVSTPSVSLFPESIDFGQIGVGTTSAVQTVTVSNTGNVPLLVNATEVDVQNAFTVLTPGLLTAHMLGVGSADVFRIVCQPPVANTYNGALRVNASGIVKTSNFTCQGVTSGISISPSPATFPPALIGAPKEQSVTITSGNGATVINSISLDATAQANGVSIRQAPPSDSPVGSGLSVVLRYLADKPHLSGPLGKLVIKASSDSMPREVTINGQALLGSIGTNPASVDFGPVCIGTLATRDVEVFANAAGAVQVSKPEAPEAPFSFASSLGSSVTLQGNHVGSATLRIGVMPTVVGEASATLRIPTDIPNSEPYPLPLAATVVPRGIGATPQMVQFGTVARNTSTSGREVTLTNCGPDKLTITGASIIGADPGEFAIVAPNNPAVSLLPTEHLTFLVIMSAHDIVGGKAALLRIEHSSGTTDVQLEGTVGSGASGNGADRETYYGCQVVTGSSSAVSGALVTAVSWLMARRRRRRS